LFVVDEPISKNKVFYVGLCGLFGRIYLLFNAMITKGEPNETKKNFETFTI
jgi:hypothetical protein